MKKMLAYFSDIYLMDGEAWELKAVSLYRSLHRGPYSRWQGLCRGLQL